MAGWALTPDGVFQAIRRVVVGAEGPPTSADPWSSFRYVEARRDLRKASLAQRPMVRIWDGSMNLVGQVPPRALTVEELATDTGTGSLVFSGNHWICEWLRRGRRHDEDVHVTLDPVPTRRTWRDRWGGKATAVTVKRTGDGDLRCELALAHNREHLKHVLCANVPPAPPEAQILRMFCLPAPLRTGAYITLLLNLARHYWIPSALIANPISVGTWLNQNPGDIWPLNWPVQPQFVNVALDTSEFGIITSTNFSTAHETLADPCRSGGVQIRAYTWLTEDSDSPHPELEALIGPLARPTRNCVVLAPEDKSGVVVPTGLIGPVDSVVRWASRLLDDSVTEILLPLDEDHDGETDPFFRQILLSAPQKPKVVFREGDTTGISESELTQSPATAHTITTGSGKTPSIVTQLGDFGIEYGLARLQDLLQGGQMGGTWQVPGTPGLSSLNQGQWHDRVLGWMRQGDFLRASRSGPFAYLEAMEKCQVAYSVSGPLAIRAGLWKNRPKLTKKVVIRNGRPWWVGDDFTLGDRVIYELEKVLFTEHVGASGLVMDEDGKVDRPITIGEDGDQEDPVTSVMRAVQGVWGVIGAIGGQDGGI